MTTRPSVSDETQAAMDRFFGVKEPPAVAVSTGQDDVARDRAAARLTDRAQRGRNGKWKSVFTQALIEAQTLFPDDGVARHRYAERDADRVMRVSASKAASRKILVDQAFLDVFGADDSAGLGPFLEIEIFPDHVVARGADGKIHRINYSLSKTGGVTFGQPQEIEQTADGTPR